MTATNTDSSPAPPRRARVPFVGRLVLFVGFVFTSLGLVESGFVIYDFFTGSLSAQRAPDLGPGVRSWTLHHAMRPGYDTPATRTNSFGLRSPEVAVPKPAGTFRILLLGDSFTLGFRAGNDQVFARRLEQMLRTDYRFPSVEVVNAGVLSYCPLLEYLQYRHQLHVLEADLVILNFDMSDVQDHLEYSRDAGTAGGAVPLFVTEPSLRRSPSAMPDLLSFQWVARYVNAARRRFESSTLGVPFARDEDRYVWALDNGPELDDEVQRTLAPIAELSALLQHHRIPLLLATYPQPWQVSADATPYPPLRRQYAIGINTVHLNDRAFRKLEIFAARHSIPYINATATFRQAPSPAGLYLQRDFHFSARGHDLYAQVLARYIAEGSFAGLQPASIPAR